MRMNNLKPASGAKRAKLRVGRGIGSTKGKTAGRGHKGQRSRSGGYHKLIFEGGQMPIHRRLPKLGFISHKALTHAEIRLHELNKVEVGIVDLISLKAANVVSEHVKSVKIFLAGQLNKKITVRGIAVTKGAKKAIEQLGGKVE